VLPAFYLVYITCCGGHSSSCYLPRQWTAATYHCHFHQHWRKCNRRPHIPWLV